MYTCYRVRMHGWFGVWKRVSAYVHERKFFKMLKFPATKMRNDPREIEMEKLFMELIVY